MKEEQESYLIGNGMVVFLAVLCTFFSLIMLLSMQGTNVSYKIFTGISAVATALLWVFRFKRNWFGWFPRALAIAIFIGTNSKVYFTWLESFKTVTISTTSCPSDCYQHPSMFGSLFLFLTVGLASLNFSSWGDQWFYSSYVYTNKDRLSDKYLKFKKTVWWFLFMPGLVLSLWTFINNFDLYYFFKTLKGFGSVALIYILVFVGFIAVIFCVFFLFSIPETRREKKAKLDYQAMTQLNKDKVITEYKRFVDSGLSCNSHTISDSDDKADFDITSSKIGGIPYAEEDDKWPESEGEPTIFCMQLNLSSSNFPEVWKGRMIVVYIIDWEVKVKTYKSPSTLKAIDISNGQKMMPENYIAMTKVPFSNDNFEDDYEFGYTAEYALSKSNKIKTLLETHTNNPKHLLEFILDDAGYPVRDAMDIILEGGSPTLIQGPHEPVCEHCNQKMRFLFEFGEILEDEFTFGDAGMVYIYGCDQHPENIQGFVDSH